MDQKRWQPCYSCSSSDVAVCVSSLIRESSSSLLQGGGPWFETTSAHQEADGHPVCPNDYERRKRVKAEYDPDNLFGVNRNVPPAR
jgi:hypothetical protein